MEGVEEISPIAKRIRSSVVSIRGKRRSSIKSTTVSKRISVDATQACNMDINNGENFHFINVIFFS